MSQETESTAETASPPSRPAGFSTGTSAATMTSGAQSGLPNRVPTLPPRSAAAEIPRPELPRRPSEFSSPPVVTTTPSPVPSTVAPPTPPRAQRSEAETRQLIVGREISLSGEINACDRLVVEGSVEANLANCREVDIAESGLFKGSASIEHAEIRGRFEGTLTVKKRLFIRATGQVVGTIVYGQIEIECGGRISGDIQAAPLAEQP